MAADGNGKGTCAVLGCTRPLGKRSSLCEAHYTRFRRNGNVGSPQVLDRTAPPPPCPVLGCDRLGKRNGSPCSLHQQRLRLVGQTERRPQARRDSFPHWTGENATYSAVHQRLRKERGHASEHICARCGERQARQWSVDKQRAEKRTPWPYSTDLSLYEPLCVSCHKRKDLA